MSCKYCHLKTHYIDKCPTIICKICKEVGHPQWLCKLKKGNGKVSNMKLNLEKKYSYGDELKKKSPVVNNVQNNISYYLKIQNEEWGNLI